MREIKFRAWDGEIMHDSDSVVVYLGAGFIEEPSLDMNSIRIKSITVEAIMQFTGLQDKSGVDIYEGDIVKIYGNIGKTIMHEGEQCTAYFTECRDIGFISKKPGSFVVDKKGSVSGWHFGVLNHQSGLTSSYLEVIGNIHENPELLKKATS